MEDDPENRILLPFFLFYLFFNEANLFVFSGLPALHKEKMVGVDVRRKAQWAVK